MYSDTFWSLWIRYDALPRKGELFTCSWSLMGVKGLIFQVIRDSCPYNQWEFDCQTQLVKKILRQAMNKKLENSWIKIQNIQGSNTWQSKHCNWVSRLSQGLVLHIVWQDIFPSIRATKGLEYTGLSVVNLHESSPFSDKQYTHLSWEPNTIQC